MPPGEVRPVDAGVRALDDLDPVDVGLAIAAETVETVAQLRGGGETAEIEPAADVEAG